MFANPPESVGASGLGRTLGRGEIHQDQNLSELYFGEDAKRTREELKWAKETDQEAESTGRHWSAGALAREGGDSLSPGPNRPR